jgi:hypothetical protein
MRMNTMTRVVGWNQGSFCPDGEISLGLGALGPGSLGAWGVFDLRANTVSFLIRPFLGTDFSIVDRIIAYFEAV